MKAVIINNLCPGCGFCPEICPEIFKMRNEKAFVFRNPVPKDLQQKCIQTANECPVEAIRIKK